LKLYITSTQVISFLILDKKGGEISTSKVELIIFEALG